VNDQVNVQEIMGLIPHRYPFLLVDRILSYTAGTSLRATKNVTANEPFFQGHFPGKPVMPGVLIIEALAQAGCLLSQLSFEGNDDERPLYVLVGVDSARFKRQVVPGDRLELSIEVEKTRRGMWWYRSEASVNGKIAATATIMSAPG